MIVENIVTPVLEPLQLWWEAIRRNFWRISKYCGTFFLDIESGAVVWKSVTGEVEDNVSGIAERIVTLCGV